MRILLDCRFQAGAGPNVQSRYLIDTLIRRNEDHEFVILQHKGQDLPEYSQLERIYVPFTNPLFEFAWVQVALPWVMRRLKIDVCHSLKHVGPMFSRVPTIIHVREVGHFRPGGMDAFEIGLALRIYWTHALAAALKRASHVFGNSQECVDIPREKFAIPVEKSSVLHNGLDRQFKIVGDAEAVAERKRRYGLPERYILCVGNLYPHKNYDTVVKALAALRRGLPDAPKLVFVGDKSYAKPSFFELIRELGLESEIVFTNFVEHADLVYIYNGASLLLFPPIHASFPNPTLEAMACGVPVVAVRRGAVPEITAGAALLVEDPLDFEEMAEAVRRGLEDEALRAELKEKGLKRAPDFSWEASAEKVFEVYRKLEAGLHGRNARPRAGAISGA